MKRLLPLAAALVLIPTAPAHAQLFGGDTEARNQVFQLRQEVQGQIETTSRGQLELAMQNEQMRAELARLRGQIELLTNEVETLKQRQKDFYVDLDARLRRIESGAAGNASAAPASGMRRRRHRLRPRRPPRHRPRPPRIREHRVRRLPGRARAAQERQAQGRADRVRALHHPLSHTATSPPAPTSGPATPHCRRATSPVRTATSRP